MMNATAVKLSFVGIGLCALVVGLGWLAWSGMLVARSRSAQGVVVDHEAEPVSSRGGAPVGSSQPLYAPVISFKATEGRTVRFTSSEYVTRARYPLGRAVRLLYDPAHPERAEIDSVETLWLAGIAWIAGGLACIAGGFGIGKAMGRMREP